MRVRFHARPITFCLLTAHFSRFESENNNEQNVPDGTKYSDNCDQCKILVHSNERNGLGPLRVKLFIRKDYS